MPPFANFLLIRAGLRQCGLPLAQVVEILRPLPVQSIGEAPAFVMGLSRIRGEALPVLDLRLLLGDRPEKAASRLVILSHLGRRVALAVDQVFGLAQVPSQDLRALPPLFEAGSPAIESLASLDEALLLLLRPACLFPPEGMALA